jgi:MYXO-CTERM domain-containing protein
MSFRALVAAPAAAVVLLAATSAHASVITAEGSYYLLNHPDGNQRPPLYGLRLDELYNATSGHDVFTFDFEDAASEMIIDITATTIRIHGVTWGGRDTGSSYAADAYRGVYIVDFVYNLGVQQVPGDDDTWVDAVNNGNSGTITTPLGDVIVMVDERGSHPYSFRLGDEDNDLGHRGFTGVSGWGWINHGPNPNVHVYDSDFLFTVGEPVPAPGAMGLAILGGLAVARRRRGDE